MGAKVKQAAPAATPAENPWRRFARWSGMNDPEADARLESDAAADEAVSRGPAWLPLALLVGLYALAVLVYILLGRGQALPQVSPDEYQYSAVARSLADGNGLTYNGGTIGLPSVLYIYAIAPAWLLTDSLTESYAIAKAIGAILVCTVAFPTWILARRYMPPLVALVPAALILAGTWMTSSGQMIFENLAFPLAAVSLTALVIGLCRPGSWAILLAVVVAGAATFARAQLAVLVPIMFVALLIDVALQGRQWRTRLRANRWAIGGIGFLLLVGGIIVLAKPSILGSYVDLRTESSLGRGIPLAGKQSLAFIAMSAVLPLILAVALSFRLRAWDESRLRALLVVFWVATVLFVIETGILTTGFAGVDWSIQRYVEYSLPLLYVLVVAGIWRRLLAPRLLAIVTGLVALVLLTTPQIKNIQEQRGTFGLVRRLDQLLGVSPGLAMALVAVITGGILLLVLTRTRATRTSILTAFVVLTGLVFVVQNQAGWHWQREQSQVWRDGFPKDLSWIDNATDRDLARVVGLYNSFRTPQTEFFNRRVTRTYKPATPLGGAPVNGFTCTWNAEPDGTLVFAPECGRAPTSFFLNDDLAKITFYDQRVIAQKPGIGRIVTVDAKPPASVRMKATVSPPCLAPIATQDPTTGDIKPPELVCGPYTQGTLYLDKPGRLRLQFRGGQADQVVQVSGSWDPQGRLVDLPARKLTDVDISVPRGTQQWQVAFDWRGVPPATPELKSILLTQDDGETELLY